MKITILCIGKTNEKYLENGIDIYSNRLKHYTRYELKILPDVKKYASNADLMDKEAHEFLQCIASDDFLIVCDEHGGQFTSEHFAALLEQKMVESTKHVIFLIGGAFGIAKFLKDRANLVISLSDMTFSHQMIRLFLVEQLYRGFTIIKNEKYHNP